jgi:CIC family chloride channel protein
MLATVVSTLVSRTLSRESIYALKLTRRGVHIEQGYDTDIKKSVTVGAAMSTDVDTDPLDLALDQLADKFARTHHHGFAVVNATGDLAGLVSIRDLEQALAQGSLNGKRVADIATTEGLLVSYPDEPMWNVLHRMGPRDISRLPVMEQEGSRRLIGLLRRRDTIRAYDVAVAKQANDCE